MTWCDVMLCVAVRGDVVSRGAMYMYAMYCDVVWCHVLCCHLVRCGAMGCDFMWSRVA